MVSRKNLISAVVLTKNEEKNIEECLKSLAWCDEIIIIDDNSADKTREIAEKLGAKVFVHPLNNNFSTQRNYGLEKAIGEWVLFVDADERVSSALAEEIRLKIRHSGEPRLAGDSRIRGGFWTSQNDEGFYSQRKDFLFGKWLVRGEAGNIKLVRFARKNAGKWERPVHEVWQVNGKLGKLKNPLLHYPHQTIKEFLENINFYTDLNAKVFYKNGIRVSWWQILAYPLGKFIKNYFLKLGFLDGMAGLLQAIFMSFHSFLTRAKLWQLQNEQA